MSTTGGARHLRGDRNAWQLQRLTRTRFARWRRNGIALTTAAIGSLPDGTLQARAVAKDKAGNTSQAATRSVQKL